MRYKELRRKYITFFSIALLFTIGLVYAILQANLQINGTAKIKSTTWDIHFDNVQIDDGSVPIGTGDTAATIDPTDNCSLSFSTTFNLPGDYYRFTFDAVNAGGINAKIDSINVQLLKNNSPIQIPDYLDYYLVKSDGSSAKVGEVIRPGTRETYLVYTGFKGEAEMVPDEDENYTYSISITFIQADKNDMGENVSQYHQLKFMESNNIDTRSGLYSVCTSVSQNAYCLYYTSPGTAGKVESIDLSTNTRTEVKTLSDSMFYTTMYPTSNGFIVAGLNVSNGRAVVSTLDSSFNIIATNIFLLHYSVNLFNITEINGKYYVLSHGVPYDSHLAIEVSADLQTIQLIEPADLTDTTTYDYLYTYSAAASRCVTGQMLSDIKPFNGGYLLVTSPDGQGAEDLAQYLWFYRNNQFVWEIQLGAEGAAQIYPKGDRIYLQAEDMANHLTFVNEYSSNGEKLHSTPVDILDDASRFMLSNFSIGEYNGNLLRLSYLPGSDPANYTQWSAYRIFTIEIGNDIIINRNEHGSIQLNKTDAFQGDTVTFTVTPNTGYSISSITVKDRSNNIITVSNNQFTMPNSSVTIDVEYSLS